MIDKSSTVVSVGSLNPVKIGATKRAVDNVLCDAATVLECSVPSGVSVQPMTTEETLVGSVNRAKAALRHHRAHYGVGLEGGLTQVQKRWFCIGWATVVTATGECGSAPSPGVQVPSEVMRLVLDEGLELGDAEDRFFRVQNSKQATGLIGIITGDRVCRELTFYLSIVTAFCSLGYGGDLL